MRSNYRHVYWDPQRGRWEARPEYKGVRKRVGRYKTDLEAHKAVEDWITSRKCALYEEMSEVCEEGELWKDVPGFSGRYMVSSFGRVKNMYSTDKMPMKGVPVKGYFKIKAMDSEGESKNLFIHILVAQAFLGYVPNGKHDVVVDHINEDKTDNRAENLQLITAWFNTVRSKPQFKTNTHCINELPSGNFMVKVQGSNLGTYGNLTKARSVRDSYVEENRLQEIFYFS